MTDRAWFDAAKGDIPQWAASMPKDADGTTIDWDWVRSLDLAHGVGTIPESTPQSIHDALKADYATRERLESIIAQCNSAFMTDFDRFIGSYRLPRALAYANRRLNDNINTLLHLGEQQHLWAVSRERRGRATIAVLKPYSGSGPSNDDQGMLDLSGEAGGTSAGNTAAENSDVKFPTTVALDDVQDRTAAILDARAERRKAQRFQKRAGDAAMARANLSGATSPGGAALPGGAAASGNATGHHPKPDWRDAYLPGRDVDAVMGIDIETTGIDPARDYIIDVGFEFMNMASPRPAGEPETYAYEQGYYAADPPPPPLTASPASLLACRRKTRRSATPSSPNSPASMYAAAAARPGTDSSTNGPKPRPACSRGLPSSRTWRITPPSNIAGSC